jgi:hypothetical protein
MGDLTNRSTKRSVASWRSLATLVLSCAASAPLALASAAAAATSVTCSNLASVVEKDAINLNRNPVDPGGTGISKATPVVASVIPAAGSNLVYCQVVFQLGIATTIRVGLPLNTIDGGAGGVAGGCGATSVANNACVEGNWNGRIWIVGNGGYSGALSGVTSATNEGFASAGSDDGYSANWCNAINPKTGQTNSYRNCGNAGGAAVLSPNNQLNTELVRDFIDNAEFDQVFWTKKLVQAYYGRTQKWTYWNACSTGGRQGMEMAQYHPYEFDGILAGSPAAPWNRFIFGEQYPPIAVADVDPLDCSGGTAASCSNGVSAAFANAYTAANAAAVAACDGDDGLLDGVVNEPRRCFYDARTLIGQTPTPMTVPMTEAQAQAINMIWDGPRNQLGQRLWGGIERGTSFATLIAPFGTGAAGVNPISTYTFNWLEQNPNFDIIGNINTTNFATYFQKSDNKFAGTVPSPPGFVVAASTDSIDLSGLIARGTKFIRYRGVNDPLVLAFASYEYDTRLIAKYGVKDLNKFYRSYYYPGNGHCGGNSGFPNAGLINANDMFNDLIKWVENGVAPTSVVAYTGPNDTGNTTLICPYPNQTIYQGSGRVTNSSSYTCSNYQQEPPDLAAYDTTAPSGGMVLVPWPGWIRERNRN